MALLRSGDLINVQKLPKHLSDPGTLYVRTTAVPRALKSVQQILQGLYPGVTNRTLAPWDIFIRTSVEETLYLNTKSCARLAELTQAFAQRAAEEWTGSDDIRYISKKLGKWMHDNKPLTVDSRPRMSAVMDTINAKLAHGPDTRLPDEFYDERVRKVIERIEVDEKFRGYAVSREFRMLVVGELAGNMVVKMIDRLEWHQNHDTLRDFTVQPSSPPRLSLSSYRDSTIGATLASLGRFNSHERWPAFTSQIIFELFRKRWTPFPSTNESKLRWQWNATTSSVPIMGRQPVETHDGGGIRNGRILRESRI